MKTVDSKKQKSRSINTCFQANYLPGINKKEKKMQKENNQKLNENKQGYF